MSGSNPESTHDIVAASIFLTLSLLMLWGLTRIPGYSGPNIRAALWPGGILIALAICSIGLFIRGARKLVVSHKRGEISSHEISAKYERASIPRLLFFIFAPFIYLGLCLVIGFAFATPIIVAGVMRVLGEKRIGWLMMVSFFAVGLFVVLFGRIVGIPLPRGFGLFRSISTVLY